MARLDAWGPVLMAMAVVATLGALELGARAIVPPIAPRTAMYRAAPEVAYELLPGWQGEGPLRERIRINADGLRGPELGAPSNGTRVLALGDSFMFGLGVAEDDTFPAALARALTAARGAPVEVLNGGVPGYNLMQTTRVLGARVAALRPAAVVLGLVENDLYNVDGSDWVAVGDGTLLPRPGSYQPTSSLNPFLASTGPWLWLQLHSAAFRLGRLWAMHAIRSVDWDGDLTVLAQDAEQSHELPTRLLRGEGDAETIPRWDGATRALESAAADARALGVPVALVLFPRPEQLYAPRLRAGFARIAGVAKRAGILVIDPAPTLAQDPDRVGLYLFPNDHHPSARGHARMAEIVAPVLLARKVVPRE